MFGVSLTSTDNAQPVTAALAFFTGASNLQSPITAIAAASVVVTIPVIIMVLVFQQHIVAGLTNGAVKGHHTPPKGPNEGTPTSSPTSQCGASPRATGTVTPR